MKICHMSSAHSDNDTRVFEKECSSLAKRDSNDVYFVVRGDSHSKNSVNIVGVGDAPKSRLKRMTSFAKKIYAKSIQIDADVYHFHDPELLPYGVKLKKKGKKVIYDSHEDYTKQIKAKSYLPKTFALLISLIFNKYEQYAVKQFDAVVSTCIENGVDYFEGKCKKSVIIDNFPILQQENKREELNDIFTLCYMGGLSKSRGLYEMIKASYITNSKLILAGSLSEEQKKIIEAMEEKKCIDYRGYISLDEVYSIYKQCDAGFSLLKRVGQYGIGDNLPTKAYECMMFSLPIIISNDECAVELMKEVEYGVIVDPENIDEICDAISRLKNVGTNLRMGLNGRKLIEERYNWSTEEKKLFDLYEQI